MVCLSLVFLLSACTNQTPPQDPEQTTPPAMSSAVVNNVKEERPNVDNNGGFFVRVGEKIWFRQYADGAIDEPQLWGNFLNVPPSHKIESTLCFYDEEGDAIIEEMGDDGFGPLWFGTDGFFLNRADEDSGLSTVYFRPVDGGKAQDLREGEVAGVSDNGRFVAIESKDSPGFSGLYIYEGTKELYRIVPSDSEYYEFGALTNEGDLVYGGYDYDSELYTVRYLPKGGHVSTILGTLPDPELAMSSAQLSQCLLDGDDVYFVFAWYEGTGNMLAETMCARAVLNKDNSMSVMEHETLSDESEYDLPLPKLLLEGPGEVEAFDVLPGDIGLSMINFGDLIWYDSPYSAICLIPEFIEQNPFDYGDKIVQTMCSIGDSAYLIVAGSSPAPEYDIGWRMAYSPGDLYYLRVPLQENSWVETLVGKEWGDNSEILDMVYSKMIGEWELVETHDEAGLPETVQETISFLPDGRVILDRTDSAPGAQQYHNVFSHIEVLPMNGWNGTDYGLRMTGDLNEDVLIASVDNVDGALICTLQRFVETENGIDVTSSTGIYYGL